MCIYFWMVTIENFRWCKRHEMKSPSHLCYTYVSLSKEIFYFGKKSHNIKHIILIIFNSAVWWHYVHSHCCLSLTIIHLLINWNCHHQTLTMMPIPPPGPSHPTAPGIYWCAFWLYGFDLTVLGTLCKWNQTVFSPLCGGSVRASIPYSQSTPPWWLFTLNISFCGFILKLAGSTHCHHMVTSHDQPWLPWSYLPVEIEREESVSHSYARKGPSNQLHWSSLDHVHSPPD